MIALSSKLTVPGFAWFKCLFRRHMMQYNARGGYRSPFSVATCKNFTNQKFSDSTLKSSSLTFKSKSCRDSSFSSVSDVGFPHYN